MWKRRKTMKITYDEAEMLTLVKRVMPKEFIPEGWCLISVTLEGHSYDRRFIITFEEKKEP